MNLQPGDRLLTLRPTVPSRLVAWWLNGAYSHCAPIISEQGTTIEARLPRIRYGSSHEYTGAKILHLRPAVPFTASQRTAWVLAGARLIGKRYDLLSIGGFLAGNGAQHHSKPNCAELLLTMDHAAGLLQNRDYRLISPQSYAEFAAAGLFNVVGEY